VAAKSLNQSIFRLIVGLVTFTAIAILGNVWVATTKHAQAQLDQSLKVAQNVFEQVLASRESLLYNSASVLTADFGFKQAVASGDKGTIDSVLLNHGARIDADLMALISLEGQNITSEPKSLIAGEAFPYPPLVTSALQEQGASSLLLINGKLYQIIMLTVNAPTPIAIALVGFQLDDTLVKQLRTVTQLETTISVLRSDQEDFVISTLNQRQRKIALSLQDQELSWLSLTLWQDVPFISRQFLLEEEANVEVWITLSSDIEQLFSGFSTLQLNITLIALLAIVLSLILALLFARRVARPLVSLAKLAQNIASGHYQKTIDTQSSSKELNHLALAFKSMQTSIRQREEKISYQAQHDSLTGLNNRFHIEFLLNELFSQQQKFAVVGINIIGFRTINDVFGYQKGDLCIQFLAKRVAELGGLAARLAGGELLWMPDKPVTMETLQRIHRSLEEPIKIGEIIINIKLTLGHISCPKDALSPEELFRRMNIVLDEARANNQGLLDYATEFEERYLRRLSIITELETALMSRQDEFTLFYQPKLDLASGEVLQVEALIRWNNSLLGFVSPEDFISIAEQAGFIGRVTDWVLSQAITDAVKFKQAGFNICIAINLSAQDVLDEQLLPTIVSRLAEHNLTHDALSLEMTENDLIQDTDKMISQLQAFRDQDFAIAMDDFGTGYASMAYLKNLPVSALKVDKSFVLNLDTQPGDQKIVKTVIELAHNFGLKVVAEGIENEATLMLLKEWGCEWAQGYYIAKPAPIEPFLEWISNHQPSSWFNA
jgi:diguanylate cyclase (GGDEF)-like protein